MENIWHYILLKDRTWQPEPGSGPRPTPGGVADLRSALHLHRVASLREVLVADPGAVRGQVQSSASKVPLLEKGHLRAEVAQETR